MLRTPFIQLLKKVQRQIATVDSINLSDYVQDYQSLKKVKLQPHGDVRYMVIENVFAPVYAEEIARAIEDDIKTRGMTEEQNPDTFSRIEDYDGYAFVPKPDLKSPYRVFYSRDWYEFFKEMSGFSLDTNVMTGLHHHEIGSKNGYVHSDYAYYYFRKRPFQNGLNHWYRNSQYQVTEKGSKEEVGPGVIVTRRALAFIYYVGNEEWSLGDGGETGFYATQDSKVPYFSVPPKHNSLLVFEVSETSHHGFLSNHKRNRNTVIQWFHEDAASIACRKKYER